MIVPQSATMPRRLPPDCVEDRDRHGNIRVYYRTKNRPKVRLRGTPWTPEFMAEYEAAKGAAAEPSRKSAVAAGTWRWLCVKYFGECADYKRLDPQTQHVRRLILESTFDEPIAPGSAKLFRDMPLSRMGTDAVEVLRDRKIDLPGAANNRVKAIRQVFKFGMRKKHSDGKPYVSNNPARDVEKFKYGSTGFPQLDSGGSSAIRGTSPGRDKGAACAGAPTVHGAEAGGRDPVWEATRPQWQADVHTAQGSTPQTETAFVADPSSPATDHRRLTLR